MSGTLPKNSQTYSEQSRPLTPEEELQLKTSQIRMALKGWTLGELEELGSLFQEKRWQLWLRFLQFLDLELQEQVWDRRNSFDVYNYLRGKHDAVKRILRAPEAIEIMKQAKREERQDAGSTAA